VIPANSSKTIDVKANIAAAATVASQITLSLADESAIVTTADVNGTFPASSGTFTVANVTLGTLTPAAAADTASGNIYPGSTDEQSFAKFRITAANEGVKLTTVTFTQNGTAGDSDLSSLKLYNASGVQVGQTASISGRRVTFDISDANIVIGNGASTTLELRGIANASSAGRNVQFGIADATDLQGVGQTYGTTVIGTATPTANTLTAATGSLLVSLDTTNPAAATIGASSTSKYASFRVQAQNEPIQLRTIQLQLVAGTVAPNTLSNITLKVGDTVIGQVQNFFTTTVAGTENKTMTLTNPLTIATGQSVVIDVYGTTGTAVAGTYRMGLFAAADTISGIGTISGNTVNVNSGATGNLMTLGVQNITVNVGANTGATIFANGINQAVGTLNISHNLPGTVNVSTVGVTLAQGGGATASLTNLRLTDADGNVVSNTIGSPNNSGTNTLRFNSTVAVAQGATSTYKVVADVNSGATAGSTITVTPGVATAVTADTGETVATAAGSGSFIATVGATVATGDVTGATSVPGLVAGNVAAGATGVEIARGTLSNGGGENVILNKITLDAAFTGTGNLPAKVSNYVIKDAGGNVLATTASLASGTTEITLSTPLTITTITPQTIKIYADFASNADGGDTIAVAIGKAATDNYFYTGASTGVSEKTNGSNITSTTFTIAASKVSVTSSVVTDTTPTAASVGPGQTLASFTFKNEGTSTVVLKNVRLTDVLGSTTGTITNSNLSGAAIVQLRNSDWTVVGAQTGPLDGITDIDVVMAAIGSGNEVIIAAGESVTLYATISTQTTPTAIAIGNSSRLRVVAGTAAAGTSYTGTDGVTAYAVNNSVTSASTITWD
jgi:adhesin/invasin